MKLKFIRAIKSISIDYIKDKFTLVGHESIESMADELKSILTGDLENTNFILVMDTDTDEIVTYLLAYVRGNVCTIIQAWYKSYDEKLLNVLFLRLLLWCEQMGAGDLVMRSDGNPEQLVYLWKMRPISVTWKVDVIQVVEAKLASVEKLSNTPVKEEPKNATIHTSQEDGTNSPGESESVRPVQLAPGATLFDRE